MTHDIVLQYFRKCFPQYATAISAWFPNGKNSIRVRYGHGQEFIFTFKSESNWVYETVDSYIERLKGD